MEHSGRRKIFTAITILLVIIVIGVSGYMIIEGDDFINALYMTVITISTVGFGEIHKLSTPGKLFTIVLILSSFGTYAYAISIITTHFVEGQLAGFFVGTGKKKSKERKMENHIIICGYGRNGQQAAQELIALKNPFLIIEQDHDVIMKHLSEDFKFVEGDATNDDVLERANIKTAKALVTTLPNDADNLYVTLTARTLNKKLIIISRATNENSEKKLKMAGVNNVVMPERVGGAHMATLVAHPDIMEFLDRLSVHGDEPTNLEEIVCSQVTEKSFDLSIYEIGLRKKTGANIIGLKTPEGEFILNPSTEIRVNRGSKLFVLGTSDQIEKLKKIIREELS
ncbi:MAG TPA: potassium channel protein [Bacteroidales bacterium]|nr:potassium channel protein [Bacteroidales bacterium]